MERHNALKFILQKRNMMQKDLIGESLNKQLVSKYVRRDRRIANDIILKWEKILNVPASLWVDKNRYCKMLTLTEVEQLEEYIEDNKFTEDTNVDVGVLLAGTDNDAEFRMADINRRVKRNVKDVKNDIYNNNTKEKKYMEEVLDEQENNLLFYEKLIRIRQSNKICADEWEQIFKGLISLIDDADETDVSIENQLSMDISLAVQNHRKRIEAKRQNDIQEYIELFGELPKFEEEV